LKGLQRELYAEEILRLTWDILNKPNKFSVANPGSQYKSISGHSQFQT